VILKTLPLSRWMISQRCFSYPSTGSRFHAKAVLGTGRQNDASDEPEEEDLSQALVVADGVSSGTSN